MANVGINFTDERRELELLSKKETSDKYILLSFEDEIFLYLIFSNEHLNSTGPCEISLLLFADYVWAGKINPNQ